MGYIVLLPHEVLGFGVEAEGLGPSGLLAGGLDADKLATALAFCQPDGLDLNSGVEDAPGQKNHEKMAAAVTVLRRLCHE